MKLWALTASRYVPDLAHCVNLRLSANGVTARTFFGLIKSRQRTCCANIPSGSEHISDSDDNYMMGVWIINYFSQIVVYQSSLWHTFAVFGAKTWCDACSASWRRPVKHSSFHGGFHVQECKYFSDVTIRALKAPLSVPHWMPLRFMARAQHVQRFRSRRREQCCVN